MGKNYFLLRHLKTSNNSRQLINGRSLNQPIENEKPIINSYYIDSIYCSDALRCRQTIDCYLKTNPAVPIQYSKLLYERDMGIWEGKPKPSIVSSNPELFINGKFNLFSTPPLGESYTAFKNRATEFLKLINKENGNILICSHNQFLKILLFTLNNSIITQEIWNSINFPYGEILSLEEFLLKHNLS